MNQHCGSPDFMAPEVIKVKKNRRLEYDCKCDMWSIGVQMFIACAFALLPKGPPMRQHHCIVL